MVGGPPSNTSIVNIEGRLVWLGQLTAQYTMNRPSSSCRRRRRRHRLRRSLFRLSPCVMILSVGPCRSFLLFPTKSPPATVTRCPQSSLGRDPRLHLFSRNEDDGNNKEAGPDDEIGNTTNETTTTTTTTGTAVLLSDLDNIIKSWKDNDQPKGTKQPPETSDEEDFSTWMEGLGTSWPKIPRKKRKTKETTTPKRTDEEGSVGDVVLSSFANDRPDDDEGGRWMPSTTSDEDTDRPKQQQQQQSEELERANLQKDDEDNYDGFRNINMLFDAADIFASFTTTTGNSSTKDNGSSNNSEDGILLLSLPPLPLQPSSSLPNSNSNNGSKGSVRLPAAGRYLGRINSLSNFIQFEAILDLAAGVNNETEPYFNSIFAAADQLFKLSKADQQQQQQQEQPAANKGSNTVPSGEAPIASSLSSSSSEDDISIVDDLLSNVTTVKELIERERYFGSLPFQLDKVFSKDKGPDKQASTQAAVIKSTDFVTDDGDVQAAAALLASGTIIPPLAATSNVTSTSGLVQAAEMILKDATARIEYLVAEASSTLLSPSTVQDLIVRASQVFGGDTVTTSNGTLTTTGGVAVSPSAVPPFSSSQFESVSNEIVQAAQRVAKESGVDVQFATDRAREVTNFAASMARVSNIVLGSGYAYGSRSGASGIEGYPLYEVLSQAQQQGATTTAQQPLFGEYRTAERIEPFQYEHVVVKGAEMGVLAGAIYEDTVQRCHKLGHSLVANGTTSNVAWMVTDSLDDRSRYNPDGSIPNDDPAQQQQQQQQQQRRILVRTITIRGFDASDDSVDREALLNDICTASSEPLDDATADRVLFHTGLLSIARNVYRDIIRYIDWASPNHKIVLNGHSVGGSLSVLLLLLITSERGVEYVRDRILRVYTHGSPPVATVTGNRLDDNLTERQGLTATCPILSAFDLPDSMVYGYIQPYDPVVRLFTDFDALYPLVDDLGADEVTLYATGPRRSLRPITRAILQSWSGWPRFRENWKGTNQRYQSVGKQHLLLPEPLRYLNDRFFSVNVGVPPTEAIVRISSTELLPALNAMFPLDVFQISLIPQAVRSFLHHFYPAYDSTIANYAAKVSKTPNKSGSSQKVEVKANTRN